MSSRTVKFSDLLTRPVEFKPLDAPPSPSTQLETLSSRSSSRSSDGSPGYEDGATGEPRARDLPSMAAGEERLQSSSADPSNRAEDDFPRSLRISTGGVPQCGGGALPSEVLAQKTHAALELWTAMSKSSELDELDVLRLGSEMEALERAGFFACDARLQEKLSSPLRFFSKVKALDGERTAAVLRRLRHAEELDAMKRDMQALVEVTRADAKVCEGVREKMNLVRTRFLPQVKAEMLKMLPDLGPLFREALQRYQIDAKES